MYLEIPNHLLPATSELLDSLPLKGAASRARTRALALVSNALEATPAGGRVEVHAGLGEGGALLEVRDTGCGIPPEELPRILERFYRTREALDEKRPGTGLGLAITQSIARLHGGELRIESEPGRGTAVRLCLPR